MVRQDNEEEGETRPPPSVRELARRFEQSSTHNIKPSQHPNLTSNQNPQRPSKRVGKFRIQETGTVSKTGQPCSRVHRCGIARKKSSLRRRTQSVSDLVDYPSSQVRKSISTSRLDQPDDDTDDDEEEFKPRPPQRHKSIEDSLAATSRPWQPRISSCSRFNDDFLAKEPVFEKFHYLPKRVVKLQETPVPKERTRMDPVSHPSIDKCKDESPTYQEKASVSCTVKSPRPKVCPPPPPMNPPSAERIKRLPSLTKADSASSSPRLSVKSPRPTMKSPPPPPPTTAPTDRNKFSTMPRLPSIPVPAPPDSPGHDSNEDCYEEISAYAADTELPSSSTSTSYDDNSSTYDKMSVSEIFSPPICSKHASCTCVLCRRKSHHTFSSHRLPRDEEIFDEAEPEEIRDKPTKVKQRFLSATLHRGTKSQRRPMSTMELEKLFKFKSEFQLNVTKKVGQLKQKVSDKTLKRSSSKGASDLDLSQGGRWSSVSKDADSDRYIYGDDWSSDDETDERRSSMYKQLEEQLNRAFPAYASSQMSEYETADFEKREVDLENEYKLARPAYVTLPEDIEPTNDEPSPEEEEYHRQYTSRLLPSEQPLYQHYMMEERTEDGDVEVKVEEVGEEDECIAPLMEKEKKKKDKSRRESSASSDSGRGADCSTSTSALTSNTSMRRERLMGASKFGSQRSLWCELAEVKAAGLLETLDDECKIRQEAYFEVITSEASYLRSLNILITHFMACPHMLGSKSSQSVISNSDRKQLFSNIFAVRDCSERLLCDLENRLEENLVLDDICDILTEHFEQNFEVYVKYCSNQVYQDRTLRRLKSENAHFLTMVQRLEEDRQCQGLDMRSFLMLPMQRITRYPLLLYAIIDRLQPDTNRYKTAARALTASNKVVRECNEGARRMERTEQLLEIDRRLIYKDPELKRIPLVSNSRYLVKRGVLTQLVERRTTGILQSRQKARTLHVFLFSDMIMLTKKKLNGTYVCKDYAARRFVDMEPIEPDNPKIPIGAVTSLIGRPHLFLCVLMRNARGKQTELLLSAESETDRERWLSAVRPPTSSNPEEKVYAEWDCPQVCALHPYTPSQQDELQLRTGDTINVLRKMPDGWLFGERVSDGASGWFPSSYVQDILNDHTRANNYRQRLRIIQAASGWRGNVPSPSTGRGGMPIMDKIRRMSNPKSYFGTIGL